MSDDRDPSDVNGYDENGDPIDPNAHLLALVKSGAWLDAQHFPPTRWAVPGLIPQGFGLLTGPPKAGKSWAVLGIALALASGGVALGRIRIPKPRPVLYLALEDGDARLQFRCRQLLEGDPIPEIFNEVTTATPAQVLPLIRAWLDLHRDEHPLVLLDTLGKVMPPALPGEGAYQRDYRIGGQLKAVIDAHPGATLLVVHHVRKVSGEDWMDSTSGTNGLNGSADFTVNLHRPRNSTNGVLRVTGRDVTEGEYAVTCADGVWALNGKDLHEAAKNAEQANLTEGLGDRSAEILALLASRVGTFTPKQVTDALDLPDARVYLSRLADAGRIVKHGRGLYGAVTSVTSSQPETPPDSPGLLRVDQVESNNATDVTGVPRESVA